MIVFLLMLGAIGIIGFIQQDRISQLNGIITNQNVWLDANQQLINQQHNDIFKLRVIINQLEEKIENDSN
jgi:predicted PurR-regulated permease PerM